MCAVLCVVCCLSWVVRVVCVCVCCARGWVRFVCYEVEGHSFYFVLNENSKGGGRHTVIIQTYTNEAIRNGGY